MLKNRLMFVSYGSRAADALGKYPEKGTSRTPADAARPGAARAPYTRVIAPSLADETRAAYLAMTPVL